MGQTVRFTESTGRFLVVSNFLFQFSSQKLGEDWDRTLIIVDEQVSPQVGGDWEHQLYLRDPIPFANGFGVGFGYINTF